MKNYIVLGMTAVCCIMLAGCGGSNIDPVEAAAQDQEGTDSETVSADTSSAQDVSASDIDGAASDNADAADDSEDVNDGGSEERELTAAELSAFEEDFNSSRYNGFLVMEFKAPQEIWWDEVFYNGAGINTGKYDYDTVEKAYVEATGEDDLFGSLTYFTSEEMEKYVEDTTGLDYSSMKHPLEWEYLNDLDLYVLQHGDTNFSPIKFISGTVKGDRYSLKYSNEFSSSDENVFEAVFDKTDTGYRMVSNLWAPETGREAGIKEIYDRIILKYVSAVSNRWDEEQLKSINISERCAGEYGSGDPLETIGYYFLDVDKDGIDELFFGANHTEPEPIYEVYSILNGSWTREFMSYDETLYYLSDDDTFYVKEKLDEGEQLVHMKLNGAYKFPRTIDTVRFADNMWQSSTDDFWKDIRDISQKEYDDYCANAESSFVNIKYTPLAEVAGASAATDKDKDNVSSSGSGFTDDELCEMALAYYEKKSGYRPGTAQIEEEDGNNVLIHLFDDFSDHTATSAWYEIDRTTGRGSDYIFGTDVELGKD
ncbi:MAG: hypothetical protein IJ058_10025 [Lachnospiraceae bacterium]|nr:hypothetical protein [Lachnospiraceae bacterium]